jgi:hypothetical protein
MCGQTIADLIKSDHSLADVELAYKERRPAAQTLIAAVDPNSAPWPHPRPTPDRNLLHDAEYKTAFDLTRTAVAL